MGGTNTGPTVLDGLVGQSEFTQVVSNHFRLNFDLRREQYLSKRIQMKICSLSLSYLAEILAIVNANDGAGHLGHDDHVPQMSLYNLGLLIWWSLLLGLAEFLDQSHWLALQAAGETPAGTAVHQLNQLVAIFKGVGVEVSSGTPLEYCLRMYLLGHIQQLIQVHTTVGELLEGTLLLKSFINLLFIFNKNKNSKGYLLAQSVDTVLSANIAHKTLK